MPSKTLKFLASALLLCSAAIVAGSATTTDSTLEEIAQYRQWTRVTEKPIPVMNMLEIGD